MNTLLLYQLINPQSSASTFHSLTIMTNSHSIIPILSPQYLTDPNSNPAILQSALDFLSLFP